MKDRAPFRWALRVYYEHTDAGGVVYHPVYASFMQQARTEMLRQAGTDLGALVLKDRVVFAVRSISMEFRAPARLDDLIEVTVTAQDIRSASITFEQEIFRDDQLLCSGCVRVASVCADQFRPVALPERLDPFLAWLRSQKDHC